MKARTMKKLAGVVGIALVSVSTQAALLMPGAFETGDTTGWTTVGTWTVAQSYTFTGGAPQPTGTLTPVTWDGQGSGGQYFVQSTLQNSVTTISRSFSMNPLDQLTGWLAVDYTGPASQLPGVLGNMTLTVGLYDSGNSLVGGLYTMPDNDKNNVQWYPWTMTLPGASPAGNYTLRLSIQRLSGPANGVALFDVAAVPEAKGWMMGGALLGIFGVGALLRRRQQPKAAA